MRRNLSLIRKLTLPALALISIAAGLISGQIFKSNHKDTEAASANITVVDNDQLIELDQSTNQLIIQKPSTVTVKNPTTSLDTVAQYAQNNNIAGQGQIPNNGNPKASYLYNWCAAIGDISPNCRASATYNATTNPYGAQVLQTVLNGTATTTATATNQPEVQGICPAPFRLPKGGPQSSPASTPSSTANEFVRLDIDMGGLGTNRSYANTYPNFTGTTTDQKDWFGTLSDYYDSGLITLGDSGNWWSSTAGNATQASGLQLIQGAQIFAPAYHGYRYYGYAVRCLL